MRDRVGGGGSSATSGESPGVRRGLAARLFAWSLAHAGDQQRRLYGDRKRQLFAHIGPLAAGLGAPVVVEIGPGAGPNAEYLAPGTRWVCVEPNVHFHPRLRRAAREHSLHLELAAGMAESIPLADGAADAVVSTLVLCSVENVRQSLAEVRRVLRPGGRFVFIEHVAAEPGSVLRRLQRSLRLPWGWVADGCRPDRETEAAIREHFASVEIERFREPLGLAAPHIAGVAVSDER